MSKNKEKAGRKTAKKGLIRNKPRLTPEKPPVSPVKTQVKTVKTRVKSGKTPEKPKDQPAPAAGSGGVDPSRPIGPGNPPAKTLFKPGQSGNPKGYPKGQPNAKTLIKYWLGQEEEISDPLNPGERIRVKIIDSMTLAVIGKARKGDVAAFRELLDRIEGKPVQSTKLLNADDKILEIEVGFKAPVKPPETPIKPADK